MVKFRAGDVIEECVPIAQALDPSEVAKRCDFCFTASDDLVRCEKCRAVWYCERRCQRDDFQLAHKYGECSRLADRPRMATDTQQLVLRLYMKCKIEPAILYLKQTLFDGRSRALCDLMGHETEIKVDQVRMAFYKDMEAILTDEQLVNNDQDRALLFKLFCQVLINSFGILDPERKNRMARVGAVLYVEGSAYDHSCAPNSIQYFEGTRLQIRALKEIDSSEEPIVIHYVDLKLHLNERKAKLWRQYYFDCQCTRCVNEACGVFDIDYERMESLEESSRMIAKQFCEADAALNKMAAFELARSYNRVRTELIQIYEKIYGKNHPYVRFISQSVQELSSKLSKVDTNALQFIVANDNESKAVITDCTIKQQDSTVRRNVNLIADRFKKLFLN